MSTIEVIGFGAMNADRLYRLERILIDGEAAVEEAKTLPGGSAANTIYALAKLGMSTGFIGAVGDDEDGKMLLHDFGEVGADASRVKVKIRASTGSALCLSDRHGRRSIYVSPGANDLLNESDVDLDYINQARILHLSSFVHQHQLELQRTVVDRLTPSVKLSFSPGAIYASRGMEEVAALMRRTWILFANVEEIKRLTGEDDLRTGARRCLELGCYIVAITMGGDSVSAAGFITDGEAEYTIPRFEQKHTKVVADTTGAGDAFATGFLWGLLHGRELEECGRLANTVAHCSLTQIGARAGLPTFSELSQKYQEYYGASLDIR
jgi:ribokinase